METTNSKPRHIHRAYIIKQINFSKLAHRKTELLSKFSEANLKQSIELLGTKESRPRICSLLYSVEQSRQAIGVWKEREKTTEKSKETIPMIHNTQKSQGVFLAIILNPHL